MGRGKLKLEFISNLKTRKTTFQKRKKGMLKKASEFSILCGTDICLFISGPKLDANQPPSPTDEFETLPPERSKVMSIINKYHATMLRKPPKKVHGLADTFVERKKKIDAEISRCRRKLYEAKHPTPADIIQHFSYEQLKELSLRLDGKIEAMKFVIEAKRESELHKKNQLYLANNDNYQLQLLLDQIQIPQSINYGAALDPGFTDPTTGMQRVFDNPTAEIQQTGQFMGCTNYMQHGSSAVAAASDMRGLVFADPTAGMVMGSMSMNHMTMFGGGGGDGGEASSVPVQAQYYLPLQVQPPMVPHIQMQYPMNVMNLASRVGPVSHVRSSSVGRNQLPELTPEF